MSYHEAVRDGIPYSQRQDGMTAYYPPCHYCSSPAYSLTYIPGAKYVCPQCRQMILSEKLAEGQTENGKRLDRAVKRISNVADINEYKSGIEWVRMNLNHPSWFQSTEEVMVALELIRNEVKAHHQVRVYGYTVDFVLPDMKVALEIDGSIFHEGSRGRNQAMRDELIANMLGDGYEVIHIKTENINTNVTKLLPAIRAVLSRRKRKQ